MYPKSEFRTKEKTIVTPRSTKKIKIIKIIKLNPFFPLAWFGSFPPIQVGCFTPAWTIDASDFNHSLLLIAGVQENGKEKPLFLIHSFSSRNSSHHTHNLFLYAPSCVIFFYTFPFIFNHVHPRVSLVGVMFPCFLKRRTPRQRWRRFLDVGVWIRRRWRQR